MFHELQGGILVADAVVELSARQSLGLLFAGGQEEFAELNGAPGMASWLPRRA